MHTVSSPASYKPHVCTLLLLASGKSVFLWFLSTSFQISADSVLLFYFNVQIFLFNKGFFAALRIQNITAEILMKMYDYKINILVSDNFSWHFLQRWRKFFKMSIYKWIQLERANLLAARKPTLYIYRWTLTRKLFVPCIFRVTFPKEVQIYFFSKLHHRSRV